MKSIDEVFQAVYTGDIQENEVIAFLRSNDVSTEWIHTRLIEAYREHDALKVEYLLSCVRLSSFIERVDTREILHLLCEIMVEPFFARSAESISDALGYCKLEKDALQYFVKLCTSPVWLEVGWPDLRKALEAIYTMYEKKVCSKSEVLLAFQTILASVNVASERRGMRECAQAYIDEIHSAPSPT